MIHLLRHILKHFFNYAPIDPILCNCIGCGSMMKTRLDDDYIYCSRCRDIPFLIPNKNL